MTKEFAYKEAARRTKELNKTHYVYASIDSNEYMITDRTIAKLKMLHMIVAGGQHQIQADRKGLIWINVSNNDPRLGMNGVIARIRPEYKHKYTATVVGIRINFGSERWGKSFGA